MPTVTTPMQQLERRFATLGFPRAFIQDLAPEWWDESLESSAQSMMLFKMHFAKHLGLDFHSLMDDNAPITFAPVGAAHYRLTQSKCADDVQIAQSLAERLATTVATAMAQPYRAIPSDPDAVRQSILATHPWVNLEGLIDYLWQHGIPVIHLKHLPRKAKKFDGMVVDVAGRPVIVLSRGNEAPAWQLFILAHEVGHIGQGHVHSGKVFIDEKVNTSDSSAKETEATQYGLHLLTGHKEASIGGHRRRAEQLAQAALRYANSNHIDPGHVILNYGHTMKSMSLAQAALKHLPDHYDAPQRITEVLHQHIDIGLLPHDSQTILDKLI